MAGKKKVSLIEGYAGNWERYPNEKIKMKHEKGESKSQLAKESKREKLLAKKKKKPKGKK
mgnify:CR=1 FL=1